MEDQSVPRIAAMQVRIVTDDFTSATDGLAGFTGLPGGAHVVMEGLGPDPLGSRSHLSAAFSVSTESRHCPPDVAATRVGAWVMRWRHADLLLKQFDSTLRGPLAAECTAAWRASGRPRLLVVPAFPAAGRTTRLGSVLLGDVPVHLTAFAADPHFPVRESSVAQLFAAVGLQLQLAANVEAAESLFAAGHNAVLVDAQSEHDLVALAERFVADRSVLWAGSTGIARALATAVGQRQKSSPDPRVHCTSPWVLVGSRHPISRVQAERLRADHPGLMVLCTPDNLVDPDRASLDLAEKTAQAVMRGLCDGLLVTGGETACALADALGVHQLELIGEVEPGVPLSLLHVGERRIAMVTKAGGFGDGQTLHRCVSVLTGGQL